MPFERNQLDTLEVRLYLVSNLAGKPQCQLICSPTIVSREMRAIRDHLGNACRPQDYGTGELDDPIEVAVENIASDAANRDDRVVVFFDDRAGTFGPEPQILKERYPRQHLIDRILTVSGINSLPTTNRSARQRVFQAILDQALE